MTFRSVKELQQQRPTVEASSRAQDASGELAMKMSKLRALSDADKDLITTLQQRIDEQKSELESRTAMVEAVQRNFENLSNMAVREREELARLRAEEEEREAEMRALQVTIKSLQADLEALRQEQGKGKDAELAAAGKRAAEERGRLHAQLEATERRLEKAEARAAEAEARAAEAEAAARRRAEEAAAASAGLEADAAALRKRQAAAEAEAAQAREARTALEARVRALEAEAAAQREREAEARRALQEAQRASEAALEAAHAKAEADLEKLKADLAGRMKRLLAREMQLSAAVAKVMSAEEAMEACLTCMSCMEVLKNPTTCVPCGHTFCGGCLTAAGGTCQECDAPPDGTQQTLKVAQLETLVAKFGFQKQALAALCTTNATAVA